MPALEIRPPLVQVAIDVLNTEDALRIAEAAVRAGADWLEVGTPLVTFAGTAAIGAIARAFPQLPVLADYKMMDGVRKYVVETAQQGGKIATICAVASDASIRTAVAAGRETGIAIGCDLYAAPHVIKRAREVEAMGVDFVYLHWGADQRNENPKGDAIAELPALKQAVHIPVGAATWSTEDGIRAFQMGADIAVIGMPLIAAADVEGALRDFVQRARGAWRGR